MYSRISLSLVMREMQRKTPVKHQLIVIRFTKINKPDNTQMWRGCGEIAFITADISVN